LIFSSLFRLPIRVRLALWYTCFLVVTVGTISVFLLAALENNLLQEVDDSLALHSSHVEHALVAMSERPLESGATVPEISEVGPLEDFSAPGIYTQVFGRDGRLLASSANPPEGQFPVTPAMVAAALAGEQTYVTVLVGDERVRRLMRPVTRGEHTLGAVAVSGSLHPLDSSVRRTQRLLLVAGAFSAVVALVSGWWLTAHGLGPVAEVSRVARQIATTGEFEQRIAQPRTHDEVAELAATFNEMLERLEKTFRSQREFLADASHELRGPLMVIRGNLDLLKLDLPYEERQACARDASEEMDRMSRLVSDLLFLAEEDAQEVVEHQAVALDGVVSETWERAKAVAGRSHEILLAHNDPAMVMGDRERLIQMLWNLVENALRHTHDSGRITLSLRSNGLISELTVADSGIGIPAEHLTRIFERFYRVDKARSRSDGGTGLGLAIVKQVVVAHGGQVRVLSHPGQGTVFTISIPTQQS